MSAQPTSPRPDPERWTRTTGVDARSVEPARGVDARSVEPARGVDARSVEPARGVHPDRAPDWLVPLVRAAASVDPAELTQHEVRPPPGATRRAAVLVLFGEGERHGPDLLLQQRAGGLRDHAGQVSFPGGGWETGDAGPVDTALREAAEETGLDPAGVVPLAVLPELYIPPSGYRVTPVLAHWLDPVAVAPVDPEETAAVVRVPVAELADPGNRFLVRHPSGWVGPAFEVAGMVVWGFTGGLVAAVPRMGGWERPWTPGPPRELTRLGRADGERWEVGR